MSTFRAWFETNLTLQSSEYSTVVLIDSNNVNVALQYDASVCRLATRCAHTRYGEQQPLVIAFCRPPLTNVNLELAAPSSTFRNSCDVPEFYEPHLLRVVACSSYIMTARGSMNRPRCSVYCDDIANMGYYHNTSTTPQQRFDGSIVRLPLGIDSLDKISEDTCQLDDYLMGVAAYILTKLGKRVITISGDKRFTEERITIPELVYPFVCVLAPCSISRQRVCAHPIYQADLGDIRGAIPTVYPHPQYNMSTIEKYKSDAKHEAEKNGYRDRFASAPDFYVFAEGQKKLVKTFQQELKSGRPSRKAGHGNPFDRLEKPDPHNTYSRFVDPFGGPPGMQETHQGHRQNLNNMLLDLRRENGETGPLGRLPLCARMQDRYAELVDPGSLQSGERGHAASG